MPRAKARVDPVTSEIILGAFETICYEMATHVSLTATTPILNQSNERNATILDATGQLAALSVGLLGLLNTLLISVLERTRELGTLRAVGMSRGQLRRMILQEALIQGGFGALAAVGLGGWISYVWVKTTLALVLGWMIDFHFPWIAVLTTVLTGILVSLLAGLYPARRASNFVITEALEYE